MTNPSKVVAGPHGTVKAVMPDEDEAEAGDNARLGVPESTINRVTEDAALCKAQEKMSVAIFVSDLSPVTTRRRSQPPSWAMAQRADFIFTCEEWLGESHALASDQAADRYRFVLGDFLALTVACQRYVLDGLRSGLAAIGNHESLRTL